MGESSWSRLMSCFLWLRAQHPPPPMQIRKLYFAAAVSLRLSDQAAVAAAGAEVQLWQAGLLKAQQAAISEALMARACRSGPG